jgi:tripartite-type tricarboxylate transporter receptor subunit TctC
VRFLDEHLQQALQSQVLREQFALEGLVPLSSTPQAFGRMLAADVAVWKEIATAANITMN